MNKENLSKSNPKIAAIWFGVSIYLNSALLLFATPIFTRLMTPAEYGEVTLYNSWFVIIGIFSTLSLHAGVFNSALLKFEDTQRQLISSLLLLVAIFSLVTWCILLITIIYIGNFTGVRQSLLVFMAFNILTNAVFIFWQASERFYYRYKSVSAVSITSSLIGVGGSVALMSSGLWEQYNVEIRIIGSALPMFIVGALIFLLSVRNFDLSLNRKYWIYGLSMGLPLIPHYLAQGFLQHFDKFSIAHYIGNEALGIYGLAIAVASGLTLFWTAINTTWIPWMLRKYRDNSIVDIEKAAPYLVNTVAAVAIIGSLLAPEVVHLLAPKEYAKASTLIPLLLVASLVQFIQSIYLTVQFQERKVWTITAVSLCSAIISVLLNLIFIPIYGLISVGFILVIAQCAQLTLQYTFASASIRSIFSIRHATLLIALLSTFAIFLNWVESAQLSLRLIAVGIILTILGSYIFPKIKQRKN